MITTRGRTVAVLGLGCIGGSLARELAGTNRVLGFDRDTASLAAAVGDGAVHRALDGGLRGIEDADIVVLAVPVDEAVRLLADLAPRVARACLVTDVGSTKVGICRVAHSLGLLQFVGSHPFAGSHRSGWVASRRGLFLGATAFLCPTPATAPSALAEAHALWRTLGASAEECTAAVHDERLAWVSHLPHIASFALALALDAGGRGSGELGTGGRDAVRLAASSPAMWRAISIENREALITAVTTLEGELVALRTALEQGDATALEARMSHAAAWCERRQPRPAGARCSPPGGPDVSSIQPAGEDPGQVEASTTARRGMILRLAETPRPWSA